MSGKRTQITKLSFFGAANGYSGFRSYFKNIFDPNTYNAIYVLKGGPGTGKSSFMKRLLTDLEQKVDECEAIYCSSDPNSLDGVILRKDNESVAVIDGTAPHASDPIFPGAVDRIINLGDHWNENILKHNCDSIKSTANLKTEAYKHAYDYLNIAGAITEKVDTTINKAYNISDNSIITSLLPKATSDNAIESVRLLTSYGKDGFSRLNTLNEISSKIYSVVGVYGSEYVFMSHLHFELKSSGVHYTVFPSVLDENKIYALYIPAESIAFVSEKLTSVPDECVIDTARFLDQKCLSKEKERLEFLWREREAFLWSATDQFRKASDEHFNLEKIYSSAMDFSKIDDIYDLYLTDIKKKLLI